MKDVKLSRRHALLASATIGGAAAASDESRGAGRSSRAQVGVGYSGGAASAARPARAAGADYQPTVTPGAPRFRGRSSTA